MTTSISATSYAGRLLLLLLAPAALALQPAQTTRRATLGRLVGGAASALLAPSVASSYDPKTSPSVFVGKYTDPNHPGGFREVVLRDLIIGPNRIAKIYGGGGRGEPASFELPAVIGQCGEIIGKVRDPDVRACGD